METRSVVSVSGGTGGRENKLSKVIPSHFKSNEAAFFCLKLQVSIIISPFSN